MIHKAKKSLGQNFLKSEQALKKIIEEGEISPSDIILEIGPGKGVLTKKLLEKSNCVIAIEKDKSLVEFLQEKFSEEIKNKKLILVEGDILEKFNSNTSEDFPYRGLSQADGPRVNAGLASPDRDPEKEESLGVLGNIHLKNYKIIANIPYNITGAILKKFLTEKLQPKTMVLMVQNEVAKRIVANDKKESILSISVKAYGTPKFVMKVPSRYFSPAPKVDSAIISIKNISRKFFTENNIKEEKFWEIIHAGFLHKRKKLSNNLKLSTENIYKNKRAEDLTLEDWINLTKMY